MQYRRSTFLFGCLLALSVTFSFYSLSLVEVRHVNVLSETAAASKKRQWQKRPLAIFWDLDNLQPPKGVSLGACLSALRETLYSTSDAASTSGDSSSLLAPSYPGAKIYANRATLGQTQLHCWQRGWITSNAKRSKAASLETDELSLQMQALASSNHTDMILELPPLKGSFCKHSKMRSLAKRFAAKEDLVCQLFTDVPSKPFLRIVNLRKQLEQHFGATLKVLPNEKEAVDKALTLDLQSLICSQEARLRPGSICLISNDAGFQNLLKEAQSWGWRIVSIGTGAGRGQLRVNGRKNKNIGWSNIGVRAAGLASVSWAGPEVTMRSGRISRR
eukprot:TRINITY_DN109277_c0_g1_i1.p1 TRINITY_DN109277_c0_g1~~TRINITY_DN109277_c0_g1_i1.p1  ORF type:complete len:332 (+),score=43.01 TRINITY_DN109277_c0_g1_i1:50-1045(+)